MMRARTGRKEAEGPDFVVSVGRHRCPWLTCCSCTQALAEAKVASWAAEPTMTLGTAPPTPRHSPARPCCRQTVSKAPRTLCGGEERHRVTGQPLPAHPAQGALGSDSSYLVMVLVPHGHRGHRLGLQLRFDL